MSHLIPRTKYGSDSRKSIEEFERQWPFINRYFYPNSELEADIEQLAKEKNEVLARIYDGTIGSDKLLREKNYLFTLGTRFQWLFSRNGQGSKIPLIRFNPDFCSVTIGNGRERTGYKIEYAEYNKKLMAIQHGGQYPRDTLQGYIDEIPGELIYAILVNTKKMILFIEYHAVKGTREETRKGIADYWETLRKKDREANRFKIIPNRLAENGGFLIKEYKKPKYFNHYHNKFKLF